MYHKHFGMNRLPFVPVATGPAYYPSATHEYVLARLLEAVQQQEGIVLLTGDAGIGKSLIAYRLLDQLDSHWAKVWIVNSHLPDRSALFQAILYDLEQAYEGKSEQELRLKVIDAVLQLFKQQRPTLVVVDEAHHLSAALLEELRLLTNLESPGGRALQVVLVGQPALLRTLRLPELAALTQRLGVRLELSPLDQQESAGYIRHHVRAAGGDAKRLLTDEAQELLVRAGKGVPRLLNQATHLALQMAFAGEQPLVDAEAAIEAIHALGLSEDVPPEAESAAGKSEPESSRVLPLAKHSA